MRFALLPLGLAAGQGDAQCLQAEGPGHEGLAAG